MRKLTKIIALTALAGLTLLLSSCSHFYHKNDAVRIKVDSAYKYSKNPYTKEYRNGSTLRGTVLKVLKSTEPDSCPPRKGTKLTTKTFVVFVDSLSGDNDDRVEFIPIEDVSLVGQAPGIPRNKWNNINLFENFNNPDRIRKLREVPVDSIYSNSCDSCKCKHFDLPGFSIECPERILPWYFLEIRAAHASYNDKLDFEEIGKQSFFGELAFGARLGKYRQWGLGVAFNYGIKIYDQNTGTRYDRFSALLHARLESTAEGGILGLGSESYSCSREETKNKYSTHKNLCIRPFLYAQLGLAIDDLSMNLTKFYMNKGCQDKMAVYLPLLNVSLPISASIGFGFDIPVSSFMDISIDFGFRTVTYGETFNAGGMIAPTGRRVNMFVTRAGVTF